MEEVEHSCLPNCAYSSKSGKLRLYAVRPIREGERVSFSYLTHLWSTPIEERRVRLHKTKNFLCSCKRCSCPDDVRAVASLTCQNKCGVVFQPIASEDNGVSKHHKWVCTLCNTASCDSKQLKTILAAEHDIQEQFEELEHLAQSGHLALVTPGALEELCDQAVGRLSRSHFLVSRILHVLATVCASHAVQMAQLAEFFPNGSRRCGTPPEMRKRAASAALRRVAISECLSCGCLVPSACKAEHDTCPEIAIE
eukprot:3051966-Amphidinium_carterae.1